MDSLPATTHCSMGLAGTGSGGWGCGSCWDWEWWAGMGVGACPAHPWGWGRQCWPRVTMSLAGLTGLQSPVVPIRGRGGLATVAWVGTQSAVPAGGTCPCSVSPPCCWVPVECPLPSQTLSHNSAQGSTLGLQNSLEHSKDLLLESPCLSTPGTEPGLSLMGPGQCWPPCLLLPYRVPADV